MRDSRLDVAKALLTEQGWAALATCRDNVPFASMVAFVCVPPFAAVVMVLSELAVHTQMMRQNPKVALVISQPEQAGIDSQTLARVTVTGDVRFVPESQADYAPWRRIYLARFPDSQRLFELGDFHIVALIPQNVRVVAGFGQILSAPATDLANAWGS